MLARTRNPLEKWRTDVFTDVAPALPAWATLEVVAPVPIYQTRRFAIPWQDTMGRAAGITPMIVQISDEDGEPAALFPFGVRESHGIRRAEFLGGKDSNANMGLIRPGISFAADEMKILLLHAARQSGLSPDAFALSNQPENWENSRNPLFGLPSQPSASFCHSARLMPDSEAFHKQQLSADTRKKMRSKRRKLEELGPVSLLTARTAQEAQSLLDAFFAQKLQRFDEKNIKSGFDSPQARSFFERCCISRIGRADASVELHGLLAGGRIVATYGGGVHRGRFHGMINSFDQDPIIARSSPGDLLLSLLIEAKCRQGLTMFDLGTGEGRYKSNWCDQVEPLFDTLIPVSAKGHAFVYADSGRRHIKRTIKQNPWAWAIAQKIRERIKISA